MVNTRIYKRKQHWKLLLLFIGLIIVSISLYLSNQIVSSIQNDERNKIKLWAETIEQKAKLVNYTEDLFKKLREEERKKVELWAEATKRLINAENTEDLTFYSQIISSNTNIPVVLTDDKGKITDVNNVDKSVLKRNTYLTDSLKHNLKFYAPIEVSFLNKKAFLYYQDSKVFSQLQSLMDELIHSFFSEVAKNTSSVPVIITDSTKTKLISYGNIDTTLLKNESYIQATIQKMSNENTPIEIVLDNYGKTFIVYYDSNILKQLKYYPLVQIIIFSVFLWIGYLLFSTFRKSEQNLVWLGMSKETAHQLGTPLSSLSGWAEIIKQYDIDPQISEEINKDIDHLKIVAERFSKIGSQPSLVDENVVAAIHEAVNYLKPRISKNTSFYINLPANFKLIIPINKLLFEWVIENLCKNAVDAMNGAGSIEIRIYEERKHIVIDISDTGKGIAKSKYKTIFNPGYTTRMRGWGLGLSLSERIIKNYHKGKIFVKSSILGKGTTFRIILKK